LLHCIAAQYSTCGSVWCMHNCCICECCCKLSGQCVAHVALWLFVAGGAAPLPRPSVAYEKLLAARSDSSNHCCFAWCNRNVLFCSSMIVQLECLQTVACALLPFLLKFLPMRFDGAISASAAVSTHPASAPGVGLSAMAAAHRRSCALLCWLSRQRCAAAQCTQGALHTPAAPWGRQ
jgi:hypothetical protein